MTNNRTKLFFNWIALILTASSILLSCQSQNEQKEKELLQKENELLKKENELLQKENGQPSKSVDKKSNNDNLNTSPPKQSVSITKADIEKAFNENQSQIEGDGRDCWTVNSFIGDLNSDGANDGLIHFGCGIKGNMGNASAGSGLAIFLNNNGTLVYQGTDENFVDFVPSKISAGLVYGEILEYGPDDARCCPSIKTKVRLKLVNNGFVKVN